MKRINTPEQNQAINEKRSCVVSAGAGSGKTTVLSERFLRLVKDGTPCNKILTITFTRKAALEMRSRIRSLLAKEEMADQIAIFHSARISTVDSFCQEIVRRGCRRYGIPGNFRLASSRELDTASRQIATDLLIQQAQSPAGRYLLSLADPSAVVQFLCTITKDTNIVHPIFTDNSYNCMVELAQTTRRNLFNQIEQDVLTFESQFSGESKLAGDIELAVRGLENLKAGKPFFRLWEGFSRSSGNREIGPIVNGLKKSIINSLKMLVLCDNTLENEENIKALYSLVARFEEQVNNYKRSAGILTFPDCMKMSIDILLSDKKTRQFYKNEFSYVMIDEFQDNNNDYRCLLYLLCEKKEVFTHGIPVPADLEGGKIFLVGDEKQSIYRFRGADVSVFKRMQEEIAGCGGTLIELDTNFRTNRPLLENLNNLFSGAMRESSRDFEARFRELRPGLDNGLVSRTILHCNVHKGREEKTEGLADYAASEAYGIANLILEMTQTEGFLIKTKDGVVKKPDYSDIAILLRTSSKQAAFEKALRLKEIPYVLSQQKDLVREAVVNDFYCLLNLVIHRTDKLCMQSVIEGPFGDEAATEQVLDSIADVIANSGIAGAVRYLWYDMGYRVFIIANPANQVYTEHFLNLYSMASSYDEQGYTLFDFLLYLKDAVDDGKTDDKESNVLSDRNDGVKIMTIHASKGLEFPIVIVANMDSSLSPDTGSLKLLRDGDKPYISCALSHEGKLANLYDKLNGDLDKQMEIAEMIRVFYVAATRAMQHLVFSGAPKETEIGPDKLEKGPSNATSLMQILACSTAMYADKETLKLQNIPEWLEYRPFVRIREEETYSTSRLDRGALESNKAWYEEAEDDSFDWSENGIAVTELAAQEHGNRHGRVLKNLDSDAFIQEKGLQTDFGTYVHALIEDSINGTAKEHEVPSGLSDTQKELFTKDARTLCNAFIESDLYKGLKEGGYELFSERSFRMFDRERNVLLKGTVDLLAVRDDSVRVIDFKTDIIRDEEVHKIQLDTYSEAVFSIYPDREISSCIFYLRDPDNVLVRKRSF